MARSTTIFPKRNQRERFFFKKINDTVAWFSLKPRRPIDPGDGTLRDHYFKVRYPLKAMKGIDQADESLACFSLKASKPFSLK